MCRLARIAPCFPSYWRSSPSVVAGGPWKVKERDSMWKKRFAPSVDCTKSVARRGKGAFRPLSTHCPLLAIWKWADARWIHSPPFSMGGHGNIFTSAGPFARVYIQNIRPYLQRLARHPSWCRRATMACKRLQTQMSIPTLDFSKFWTSRQ